MILGLRLTVPTNNTVLAQVGRGPPLRRDGARHYQVFR